VFIWAVATPARLEAQQLRAVAAPENQVFLSSATVWAIAIKHAIGRLVFPIDVLDETARRMGFEMLPISQAHAIRAGSLPRHHADPFDRMLVAQAMEENLVLVTSDPQMARYDVRVLGN
jgi:PIN domain nuclease of toxin-antitoxin system